MNPSRTRPSSLAQFLLSSSKSWCQSDVPDINQIRPIAWAAPDIQRQKMRVRHLTSPANQMQQKDTAGLTRVSGATSLLLASRPGAALPFRLRTWSIGGQRGWMATIAVLISPVI